MSRYILEFENALARKVSKKLQNVPKTMILFHQCEIAFMSTNTFLKVMKISVKIRSCIFEFRQSDQNGVSLV